MVECEDGYNRSGDFSQYSCGLNGTGVDWMFNGSEVTCSPGKVATNTHMCNYTLWLFYYSYLCQSQ